ncbi:MAG: hypothetical protein JXR03_13640 [Cyclobacteriaceae bacterium]
MEEKKEDKEVELFERYKLLVAARNFHYENFNKWLTYFYVANAAVFVGYIQLISSPKLDKIQSAQYPVLIFGFAAGLLLYWSSKGYYYWNINFIMLVNHYEKKLLKWKKRERIYSMFANKSVQNNYFNPSSGANFSTSKIAILFAYIIVTSWGALLANSILSLPSLTSLYLYDWLIPIVSIVLSGTIIIGIIWLFGKKEKHILWSNTVPLHDLEIK